MKEPARRRRVMQRSIKLGHCICDPQKPCPCDLLKEKDVCLCAGERMARLAQAWLRSFSSAGLGFR